MPATLRQVPAQPPGDAPAASSCASSSACNPVACPAAQRVVCHCHQVTEATLREIIDRQGVESVDELTQQSPAGSGCRACHCRLQRMVRGLPAVCAGRFDKCGNCGCINAICQCDAVA